MNMLLRQVAALLAGCVLAALSRWELGRASPELQGALEVWIAHTLDFVVQLTLLAVHGRLRRPLSPGGEGERGRIRMDSRGDSCRIPLPRTRRGRVQSRVPPGGKGIS